VYQCLALFCHSQRARDESAHRSTKAVKLHQATNRMWWWVHESLGIRYMRVFACAS
jgi:hypothetical protein